MKKILIIFLTILIMVTVFVLPSSAAIPGQFDEYQNLLDIDNDVSARFYLSSTDYETNRFFTVSLKPNTDYTFYSTLGTNRFFVGENVIYNNYSSTFSFDSKNLFVFNNGSFSDDGLNYTIENGVFTINGTISSYAFIHLNWVGLEEGDYYLMGFTNDNSSNYNLFMYNNQDASWYSYGTASGKSISSDRVNEFIIRFSPGTYSDFKVFPMLVKGDDYGEFMQGYMNPIYNDEITYIYNFRTPSNVSLDNTYLIGVQDATLGSDYLFSGTISENNNMYLIEGMLSAEDISNANLQESFDSGFNSGYDQGYKEGEFDGLNSTKFMNSTLLTSISAPFVIVSSALDFDIFGINFYSILQVIFTLLLVAFVVTKLKGRE